LDNAQEQKLLGIYATLNNGLDPFFDRECHVTLGLCTVCTAVPAASRWLPTLRLTCRSIFNAVDEGGIAALDAPGPLKTS
jgi:hypothetical protein